MSNTIMSQMITLSLPTTQSTNDSHALYILYIQYRLPFEFYGHEIPGKADLKNLRTDLNLSQF